MLRKICRTSLQWFPQPGLGIELRRPDDGYGFVQFITGPVAKAVLAPIIRVQDPFDAVTLTADLGGDLRGVSGGIKNGRVRLVPLMESVAAQRILVGVNVTLGSSE